ncbi:nitrogen permease regulator of amino acid transport activity 3-domain-containing protein [Lasiosphaeris hirsuta]|uniref:Nitrogen permease regulator 3 n=1 Tax=Lasiosphaeris hirsuta TaxID=260670 RepID=A0AA40E709_9PEZI|nr:nitrogen permease regulator of amino acid transport activity 3-domain-containing protein [Lasiosphaeris hirsuta]
MALPVLPSPSNFLGVALVINRSRDGPRFVFHYPQLVPAPGLSGTRPECGKDADDDNDLLLTRPSRLDGFETSAPSAPHPANLAQWNHDDHLVTESGTQIVPWEHVAGFPTKDLENILTPARAYHKRLFQVSLDPLYCVSYPIYVPENGVWRKKKRQQRKDAGAAARRDDEGVAPGDTDSANRSGEKGVSEDQSEGRDPAKGTAKTADEAEDKKSSMTMFNLVFFLKPKKHEVKDLVDVMFVHIIKKINKAYKYCQQRSDFVWKESKKILALKDKGREDKRNMSALWEDILQNSSLAQSMQDIYDAVSQNKIAALQLETIEGMVTHSVQIPVPFHISDIPQDLEGDECGLWMTTANSLISDEAVEEPSYLDKNFGLLLLADEKKISAELQGDPDDTTVSMIEFVRHCKPTLSFYQVGQQSSNVLTPLQVRKYAQHFIYWRRAIAIPPLHARDMYIVNPNCDMRKLPQATARWARQFPLLPALPNFLAELSVSPRPYKLHCPSKAHRPVYMAMLAWLMRGGWVTQLCTFAYVVVWPEIIYEVEYALEAEDIARTKRSQSGANAAPSSSTGAAALGDVAVAGFGMSSSFLSLTADDEPSDVASSVTTLRDLSLSHSQSLAPHQSSDPDLTPPSPRRTLSDPQSHITAHINTSLAMTPATTSQQPTAAEKAAEKARLERIADKAARELAERATAHARKAVPEQTAHPSVNAAKHLVGTSPHIILDAKKATGKESLYLSVIEKRLRGRSAALASSATARISRDRNVSNNSIHGNRGGAPVGVAKQGRDAHTTAKDDGRVADAWGKFSKYFNGQSALERIALQEDMKRKDVWNLLTAMSEYLLCVRHW